MKNITAMDLLRAMPIEDIPAVAQRYGLRTFGEFLKAVTATEPVTTEELQAFRTWRVVNKLEGTLWITVARVEVPALVPIQKIQAIKLLRQLTGWPLKEAKDFIDALDLGDKSFRLETEEGKMVWATTSVFPNGYTFTPL